MGKKTLVASGCSFTFEPWNWPGFVSEEMGFELINVGMASQGNGLISKKVIYTVNNLLKTHNPDDIIVGVMWSGVDRNEFFVENYPYISGYDTKGNVGKWIENPTNVVDHEKNWLITNIHWKIPHANLWYRHFHTNTGAMIQTIQNILTTQWFLEKRGVKYFMSTYMDIFQTGWANEVIRLPEVKYLYDMIDFSSFLPVLGCYDWVKENYNTRGGFPDPNEADHIGDHPTEFGHKKFANEIVVPFIKSKNLFN